MDKTLREAAQDHLDSLDNYDSGDLVPINRTRGTAAALREALAAAAPSQKPFGHFVYIAAEQRGEFVHDLDEAIEDLTNCECEVTALYDRPAALAATSAPAEVMDPQQRVAVAFYANNPEQALSDFRGREPPPESTGVLLRFYGVGSMHDLVEAQAAHIVRLQSKLPKLPSSDPQRVRGG